MLHAQSDKQIKCNSNFEVEHNTCNTSRGVIANQLETQRLTASLPHLQRGCLEPVTQAFTLPQLASPVPVDPKLPSYPSQFPSSPSQIPPEMGTAQGVMSCGAPRMPFPGNVGMTARPGMNRTPGAPNQLRLPPNQLRLQLQQRLQGPQQVDSIHFTA